LIWQKTLPAGSIESSTRELGEAVAIDVIGRIALSDGTAMVRDTIRSVRDRGDKRIVLNLSGVDFVDSSGLGELVRTHTSVRHHGGQLKIASPSKNVADLFRMTKLDRVLEIEPDEASALNSFRSADSASA
jgi:anti-sigma B factor antagonist